MKKVRTIPEKEKRLDRIAVDILKLMH